MPLDIITLYVDNMCNTLFLQKPLFIFSLWITLIMDVFPEYMNFSLSIGFTFNIILACSLLVKQCSTYIFNIPSTYCTLIFWLRFLHCKVYYKYTYVLFHYRNLILNLIRIIVTKRRNTFNIQSGHLYSYFIHKSISNYSGFIHNINCVSDSFLTHVYLLKPELIISHLLWLLEPIICFRFIYI